MIWTLFQPCICWLYRASPSLPAKNIINLISVLAIWRHPYVRSSLVLLKEGVCYDLVTDTDFSHYMGKDKIPKFNILCDGRKIFKTLVSKLIKIIQSFKFCSMVIIYCIFLLLLFSCPVISDSLQPHGWQHRGLPILYHLPKFAHVHVHCIGDAILWCPLLLPSKFPSFMNFSNESTFCIRWP